MPPPRLRPAMRAFLSHLRTQASPIKSQFLRHSSFLPPTVREWGQTAKRAVQVILVTHLFMSYIGQIGPTDGISMMPTIPNSGRSYPLILESRLHRRGRGIAVGDVVTYKHPVKPNVSGAKRVVGMPGDFVSVMTPGRQSKDRDKRDDEGDWANMKEEVVRVPEGHCWLAGDNLEWSRDSRVFGAVPLNLIKGKVLAVMWPWHAIKWLGGKEGIRDVESVEGSR